MKRIICLVIAILGIVLPNIAQENSLLWEVTRKAGDKPSYLYGTVHVQDKRVFAFDNIVYEKIESCDALAVELVMDQLDMESVKEQMFLKEGTLKDFLTDAEYILLDSVVKAKLGQSVAVFIKMKPFFLSAQLMQVDIPKDMPLALDMHFIDTARQMNHEVIGLEELSDQIGAIDKMSNEEQAKMLMDGLGDAESNMAEEFEKLTKAYLNQDLNEISKLSQDTALPESFGKDLLVNRNYGMAKAVRKIMKKKTVFAAFGAAHLVGEEGVIALLRKKGYTVKPVEFKFAK